MRERINIDHDEQESDTNSTSNLFMIGFFVLLLLLAQMNCLVERRRFAGVGGGR